MQRLQMRWYAGAILCVLSAMVCMFVYQTRAFAASVTTTISVTPELGGSKLSEKLQSLEDTEQILVLDVVESTAGASGSSRLDLRIPTDKHITKVILQTQNGASLSNYTIFFCGIPAEIQAGSYPNMRFIGGYYGTSGVGYAHQSMTLSGLPGALLAAGSVIDDKTTSPISSTTVVDNAISSAVSQNSSLNMGAWIRSSQTNSYSGTTTISNSQINASSIMMGRFSKNGTTVPSDTLRFAASQSSLSADMLLFGPEITGTEAAGDNINTLVVSLDSVLLNQQRPQGFIGMLGGAAPSKDYNTKVHIGSAEVNLSESTVYSDLYATLNNGSDKASSYNLAVDNATFTFDDLKVDPPKKISLASRNGNGALPAYNMVTYTNAKVIFKGTVEATDQSFVIFDPSSATHASEPVIYTNPLTVEVAGEVKLIAQSELPGVHFRAPEGTHFIKADIDGVSVLPTQEGADTAHFDFNETVSASQRIETQLGVTVSFDTQGGNKLEPVSLVKDDTLAANTLPRPTRYGYTFVGWATDPNGTEMFEDRAIERDATLYAIWHKDAIPPQVMNTVSFETNGGEPLALMYVAANTAPASLPVPLKEGYTFKGWFVDSDFQTPYQYEPVTKSMTLYALWELDEYKVDPELEPSPGPIDPIYNGQDGSDSGQHNGTVQDTEDAMNSSDKMQSQRGVSTPNMGDTIPYGLCIVTAFGMIAVIALLAFYGKARFDN